MTTPDQIEISLSKKKLTRLLVFSILFVAGGLWMLIGHPQTGNPVFNNPVVKYGSAVAGVLMGLFGIYYTIRKMGDKKPGLILNKEGIIDNSSAVSAGLVKWEDITEIRIRQVYKQKFIMVIVKNPEDYINRASGIKKRMMKGNLRTYGSPVSITTSTLNYEFDRLLKEMEQKLAEKKSNPTSFQKT